MRATVNKARRKEIDSVIGALEKAKEQLEVIRDDEQDYFDNMPESFQYAEKGEAAEEAISNLDYAIDQIDEVIENAASAKGVVDGCSSVPTLLISHLRQIRTDELQKRRR